MSTHWEPFEHTTHGWCTDDSHPGVLSVELGGVDPKRGQMYRFEVTLGNMEASGDAFGSPRKAMLAAEMVYELFTELQMLDPPVTRKEGPA